MMHPLPPLPHSYVQNAVAQNIAAAAYKNPLTIEEISKYTGIPAYYIEEEIITELIQAWYITRTSEGFSLNIISMTNVQYNMLKEVLSKTLNLFKNELVCLKEKITSILKGTSPKHLSPQLDFLINYFFSDIGDYIIKAPLDKGILTEPIDFKTIGLFIFKKEEWFTA